MVVRELFVTNEDGTNLYKTYSDQGFMILQVETGIAYSEAIDIEDAEYTYTETDIPIEEEIPVILEDSEIETIEAENIIEE